MRVPVPSLAEDVGPCCKEAQMLQKQVVILALFATSAYADVFKCRGDDGSVLYQPTPCASDQTHEAVKIYNDEPTAHDHAAAKQRSLQDQLNAAEIDAQATAEREKRDAASARRAEEERDAAAEKQRQAQNAADDCEWYKEQLTEMMGPGWEHVSDTTDWRRPYLHKYRQGVEDNCKD